MGRADLRYRDWHIVNYLRALAANPATGGPVNAAPAGPAAAAPAVPKPALQLADYAQLPITGDLDGKDTRGELARVNFLRDEPGGRRFFVNDLNGPLYILDKQTKAFTTYLDFNGADGRPGLFAKLTFERNFATGLINFVFDPDYPRNGVFYTSTWKIRRSPRPSSRRPAPCPASTWPATRRRRRS